MQKRGQAAMEFLTTYGWAILILIIVIGLIYSLNIFNPKIENNCIGSDPIDCSDVIFKETNAVSTNLTLFLTANGISKMAGQETKITMIILNAPKSFNCTAWSLQGVQKDYPIFLQDSTNLFVTCRAWGGDNPNPGPSNPIKAGTKFSGRANIAYKLPGSTNSYMSTVIFSGTVEP